MTPHGPTSEREPIPVSVVIPAYRAAGFLDRTLRSVAGQTVRPREIIVVDDCSPDGTVDVARAFARNTPIPVTVISLEVNSGGPSKPVNIGIAAATSPFIATLDHDDALTPDWIMTAFAALRRHPQVDFAFGRVRMTPHLPEIAKYFEEKYQQVRSFGIPLHDGEYLLPSRVAYAELVEHLCYAFTCSSFVFRKSLWNTVGGFDERIRVCTDFRYLQKVAGRGDLLFVDQTAVDWTWSQESLYKRSQIPRVAEDLYRVYVAFQRKLLDPQRRTSIVALCRGAGTDLGEMFLRDGQETRAFHQFLTAMRYGGIGRRPVMGLLSALSRIARRNLTGRSLPQEKSWTS